MNGSYDPVVDPSLAMDGELESRCQRIDYGRAGEQASPRRITGGSYEHGGYARAGADTWRLVGWISLPDIGGGVGSPLRNPMRMVIAADVPPWATRLRPMPNNEKLSPPSAPSSLLGVFCWCSLIRGQVPSSTLARRPTLDTKIETGISPVQPGRPKYRPKRSGRDPDPFCPSGVWPGSDTWPAARRTPPPSPGAGTGE